MARPATGREHIEEARKLLKAAKTADELRLAQAILLPLELGLSLEQTAACIGRSVGATCTMRTRFSKITKGTLAPRRKKTQLRNRAHTELQQEAAVLDEVLAHATEGGIVGIPSIHHKVEQKLGKKLSVSTVYRMLARHGWRKLAPDTRHPKGDEQARFTWKKNSAAN